MGYNLIWRYIVDKIWVKLGKPLIGDPYFLLIYSGPPNGGSVGIRFQFEQNQR